LGVKPCSDNCLLITLSLSTATKALFHFSKITSGVLPGATKAYQLSASKPGKPDSAIVGTLGRVGARFNPVVAIAMSLPFLI
jgi:hypothetical protein